MRLQALDASGQILADIGGPYVIAPVRGVLSLRDERTIRFVPTYAMTPSELYDLRLSGGI